MDLTILDRTLTEVAVCDIYKSFIWTDRYGAYDDFELLVPATQENVSLFNDGWYMEISTTDKKMIIEDILLSTNYNGSPMLSIKGRSPESILERRIVTTQTNIDGSLQLGVKKLLDENIINPTFTGTGVNPRKIPNFIFKTSTDQRIVDMRIEIQITYANLYDAIREICAKENLGFSLTLDDNNTYTFELYLGQDRSYDQIENQYVIFSPNNDNMLNSNYLESSKMLKTHITIGGEGEGVERVLETIDKDTTAVGIDRRELFIDARDISSNKGSAEEIPMVEYKKLLVDRGNVMSAEHVKIQSFEGEAETSFMFVYGRDFHIGDIVQIENEFGITARTRVTEIVFTDDEEGTMTIPTFTIV